MYDTTTERYSHLRGFSEEQITMIMFIVDTAKDMARRKLDEQNKRNETGGSAPDRGFSVRDGDGLYCRAVAAGGTTRKKNGKDGRK